MSVAAQSGSASGRARTSARAFSAGTDQLGQAAGVDPGAPEGQAQRVAPGAAEGAGHARDVVVHEHALADGEVGARARLPRPPARAPAPGGARVLVPGHEVAAAGAQARTRTTSSPSPRDRVGRSSTVIRPPPW